MIYSISPKTLTAIAVAGMMISSTASASTCTDLSRERTQVRQDILSQIARAPVSTTCAVIGLGAISEAFISQLDRDDQDALAAGAVVCLFYCSASEEAECFRATAVITPLMVEFDQVDRRIRARQCTS